MNNKSFKVLISEKNNTNEPFSFETYIKLIFLTLLILGFEECKACLSTNHEIIPVKLQSYDNLNQFNLKKYQRDVDGQISSNTNSQLEVQIKESPYYYKLHLSKRTLSFFGDIRGGEPPYKIQWNTGETTKSISRKFNVGQNYLSLKVRDNLGKL